MTWTYRPALDGLRAVAVYLVVAFHAGVATLDGGFVGVDLFFVLSGFLVSSILLSEADETGNIRLGRFYARRVRRLLPAALVVITATAAAFVLVAPLARRLPLVTDAQSSLLYVANWRFLFQQTDYFGADIDRSPYLHFWSLSIEEQFYIVFPVLLIGLIVLARRWRGAVATGIAVLFVLSVAAQIFWSGENASHAYYGTEARAYQLLAGVLAALVWRRVRARSAGADGRTRANLPPIWERLASPAAVVALTVVVVLATGMVTLSASARGLAVTSFAALLVLSLAILGDRGAAAPLSLPTPVYLGRVSYGTYLWHWPVILVLFEVLDTTPWVIALIAAAISTSLAALSFHVLEHPLRTSKRLARHHRLVVGMGLAASVVVAVAVVPTVLNSERRPALVAGSQDQYVGVAGRPVPTGIKWFRFADDKGPSDTVCTPEDLETCVVEPGGSGSVNVMLVGDSHARMIAPVMQELAAEHGFALSLNVIEACPWQEENAGLGDSDSSRECAANRADVYGGLIEDLDVDVVVLSQQPRDRGKYLEGVASLGYDAAGLDAFTFGAMRSTLDSITAAGARPLMVEPLLSVPEEQANPLECLSGAEQTTQCLVPVPLEEPPSANFIRTLAVTEPEAASVSLNSAMCPSTPLCEPLVGRIPVWRDRNHFAPAAMLARKDEIWTALSGTGLFD